MTDRKLLEDAAKAAGIDLVWDESGGEEFCFIPSAKPPHNRRASDKHRGEIWNPLSDDGDALRLAVKLQLTVCNEHCTAGVTYCTKGLDWSGPVEDARWPGSPDIVVEGDYAATRRAIVRAAAALSQEEQR